MSAPPAATTTATKPNAPQNSKFKRGNRDTSTHDKEKEKDVRTSNIIAAKAVADSVRTSLGPRGMDKMIVGPKDEVIISNDGATILNKIEVAHPCAKMVFNLFFFIVEYVI